MSIDTTYLLEPIFTYLRSVEDADTLGYLTERVVEHLLRRDEDAVLRERMRDKMRAFFDSVEGQEASQATHKFSTEVISLIVQVRHQQGIWQISPSEVDTIHANLSADSGAPVRGKATEPTRIVVIPPPTPEIHESFERAFAAALRYRVGVTLTFFQRWNPRVLRRIRAPFLMSPAFGVALNRVIEEKIAPAMLDVRAIRHLGTLRRWSEIDSAGFWKVVEEGRYMESISKAWDLAWDQFRPQKVKQKTLDGDRLALRAGPDLRWLREILASDQYALPEIRTREIDFFASFLEPDCSREELETTWVRLRQTYEQELDRRLYQDKARAGSLRDGLLECFEPLSPRTAEFLSLLCYRNFPYLTMAFLDAFTHNHGSNEATRKNNIPFLMWYLGLPEAVTALEADERWIVEVTERDKVRVRLAEQEEDRQRLAEMGAVAWQRR